jgi:hypothetical protein
MQRMKKLALVIAPLALFAAAFAGLGPVTRGTGPNSHIERR